MQPIEKKGVPFTPQAEDFISGWAVANV